MNFYVRRFVSGLCFNLPGIPGDNPLLPGKYDWKIPAAGLVYQKRLRIIIQL